MTDKLDELLTDLDSGGDRDVTWSARAGDSVLLNYSDGTSILVTAKWASGPQSQGSSAVEPKA